jgi:hypothetical protein
LLNEEGKKKLNIIWSGEMSSLKKVRRILEKYNLAEQREIEKEEDIVEEVWMYIYVFNEYENKYMCVCIGRRKVIVIVICVL